MGEIGLQNFILPLLYSEFDEQIMIGTSAHLKSSPGCVDAELLWQLTLKIAIDFAESCSLFSTLCIALLLADVNYLM